MYAIHPVANIMPEMDEDQFELLVEDIRKHGIREPIVIYDNMVVDGRNRKRAAEIIGFDPPLEFLELAEGDSLVEWVLSRNLHRRHLSTSQRAMIAEQTLNMESSANLRSKGKAAEKVAKAAGVSTRSVESARRIASESPEMAEQVRSGSITLHKAEQQLKAPRPPDPETDEVGNAITDPEVLAAFKLRIEFSRLAGEIRAIKRKVEAFASEPVAAELDKANAIRHLDSAAALVAGASPYAVCNCGRDESCKKCRGLGWMTKEVWKRTEA